MKYIKHYVKKFKKKRKKKKHDFTIGTFLVSHFK